MTRLVFDKTGERLYETGVDRGVLYVKDNKSGKYGAGVAWNGLINVTESPSGAETTPLYADNIKYVQLQSAEEFGATIEAYTYPDEFEACDGSATIGDPNSGITIGQQDRSIFGMSYRTVLGNDVKGNAHGYKIHLIYGALAAPSEKAFQTINDSPEAITFSWEVTCTPVEVAGHKPTATLVIDSTKVAPAALKKIEDKLYGDESAGEPSLPTPDEILELIKGLPV